MNECKCSEAAEAKQEIEKGKKRIADLQEQIRLEKKSLEYWVAKMSADAAHECKYK